MRAAVPRRPPGRVEVRQKKDDMRRAEEDTVGPLADEDKVAGRWVFRATYQGDMPGASPVAVGKHVEYAGMDIFRVEAGKIVEYWLCADILQLLQQVGMIPS